MKLSFTVHGAPVPKARARVMTGYSFTPKRVRDWEGAIKLSALSARPHGWPLDAEGYDVRIAVYRAARRGDIDNQAKSVLDALNKGVAFSDDRLIRHLEVWMYDDKADPRVYVEVEPLEAA